MIKQGKMRAILGRMLVVLVIGWSTQAGAVDFRAVASGSWDDPGVWSPNGVPGLGDTVLGLGSNDVVVTGTETIGDGTLNDAITLVFEKLER